jgi:outer membrane receptor protein involved in Fe transport
MYTRRNVVWIPNGNNASGLFLNVMRGDQGYTPGNDDSLVLNNDLDSRVDSWVTSLSAGWSPTASFSHRVNFGMDYTYSDYTDFKPYGNYEQQLGSRQNDTRSDRNITFDYNGSWRTDVTDMVSSAFSWGGQLYEENSWGLEGTDADFAGPGEQLVGGGTLPNSDEDREIIRSGGFFLQEVIGLSDRLFITGGVRWDGFSTFGSGFGLAAYPKISAAYTISEESFFPEIAALDALKLRSAWGKSGRAPGSFDAVKVYEGTQADEAVPGLVIDNLGNPDLGPEVSQELEAGFELSMFDSRFTVDFTWYDQKTKDALIPIQEAPSFGTPVETWFNLGETANWGTETVVNVVPVRTDNVEWSINGSYSTNDSEILDLGPLENYGFSLRVGEPIRVEYDEVVTNVNAGPGILPDNQLRPLGVLWPTQLMSLGTRLTLSQALTFDVLAEGQYGFHKAIGVGWANVQRESWPACYGIQDAWDAAAASLPSDATGAEIAAASGMQPQQIGTCVPAHRRWGSWVDRADFMRLRSATLSYRLPEDLVPGTRSATVALQAKNLFTWTKYQGLDPEATDGGLGGGGGGINTLFPTEYYNMAPPRVFIFNVTVNF